MGLSAFQKRTLLFWTGCIGVRLAATWLAYAHPQLLPWLGLAAGGIAMGFLIIYFGGLRETGPEVFGERIWWNALRPVHAALYGTFAYLALRRHPEAWRLLAIDVVLVMSDLLLDEETKAPTMIISSKKFKKDFVDTIDKSLILLATYLWGEALKSLFDPSKGVFKSMGHMGPWIVAVVATCIVAWRNMRNNKDTMQSPQQPLLIGGFVALAASAAGAAYMATKKKKSSGSSAVALNTGATANTGISVGDMYPGQLPPTTPDTVFPAKVNPLSDEDVAYRTLAPDSVVTPFAFELYGRDKVVPTVTGRVARKVAGNPPYNLVQCNLTGGYAVRWNSTFLTLESSQVLKWTETKQEPHSCWKIVPGYCGDTKYVMLRSLANNMFLTIDLASDTLVCKDIPTARTAKQYCWKLEPDVPKPARCGCEYDYSKGKIVCIPCDVKKLPTGNESCDTVTPGYKAECCLTDGAGRQNSDPFCRTAAWPEVVGRSLREAMLYIRTRRPDLVLSPCPNECTQKAFPEPKQNVVVIPYDPRSGIVTAAARRLV